MYHKKNETGFNKSNTFESETIKIIFIFLQMVTSG